ELLGIRLLEGVDFHAGRIDAGHHRADRAVLARRVHGLEDDQESPAMFGVEPLLEVAQGGDRSIQPSAAALVLRRSFGWRGAGVRDAERAVVGHAVAALRRARGGLRPRHAHLRTIYSAA